MHNASGDHRDRARPISVGAFPLGARIEIVQAGAGQITVGGAGITLRLPPGKQAKTRLQYSIIALTKRGADESLDPQRRPPLAACRT